MIAALVLFPMPPGTTTADAAAIFRTTAPRYLGLAGLIRKHYVFDAARGRAGGIYVWESRAAAEAAYNEEWRALVTAKYGAEPDITLFEVPVTVDNLAGTITEPLSPAAASPAG